MQGVVYIPQNPQQGSPPPNNTIVTDLTMDIEPKHQTTKELTDQSDSGIFSTTTNSAMENADSDNRSDDCTSPSDDDDETGRKSYICPICETILTSQHEFTLHIRSHNNDNEIQDNSNQGFTCRICLKVLSSSSSLDRHVLVHSGERPFHCKFCGDTFTTNGNMHRHMRTHTHKGENYDESDASSDSNSLKSIEFNNNNNRIIGEKRGAKRKLDIDEDDEDCKRFKSDEELFKCPLCERADFDTADNLETHLEDNHPDYPAKCNQCNQIFQNNKLLLVHRSTVHDTCQNTKHPVLGFKDLTFVDFSSEKFPHIARHECERNLHKASGGGLKFQCKRCTRAFPCASSLEIHEKDCILSTAGDLNGLDLSRTTLISDKEIRRNEFFMRLDLQDNSVDKFPSVPPSHSPSHETSNKLRQQLLAKAMCAVDSNKDLADIQSIISMTTNGSLLQQLQGKNEQVLQGLKPCPDLDTSKEAGEEESQDVFALEFRKMKLRGEFPCRLCTAVFPNLRALKGHNRAHLNGNNNGMYRCNMCPHSSIDKAALIRHMRTHNGDRPYECSLCNYAFTTKANCERHLRNRHAKTTREEVKKSIIYHPSEDPTNDELNKLTPTKEDIGRKPGSDCSITPKILLPEIIKPETPLIPTLLKENIPLAKEPKIFSNIVNKSLQNSIRNNGQQSPYLHPPYLFAPQNISTPNQVSKIHVKNLEELKETSYDDDSEDECNDVEEEPMNLVLDLSKKKNEEKKPNVHDLSKKTPPPPPLPAHPLGLFPQPLLKTPPKLDPATYLVTQLAMCRNNFPGFPGWPGFPINPLLFQSLHNPIPPQDPQEFKERLQRTLCGGSMISDNFAEHFKNLRNPPFSPEYSPKRNEEMQQPLSLNVESPFSDAGYNSSKIHSPIQQIKQEQLIHSPNSVKMVIKNGVLMPKQKQRRYRTERPFTCEHCSARFTLRSNMERHIKQQHPQYWSQRQRGLSTPGRKSQTPIKPSNYCDLAIPNYELMPKSHDYDDTKEQKLKYALLAQHLRNNDAKREEEEEDCALVIDENNEEKSRDDYDAKMDEEHHRIVTGGILEEKLRELHNRHQQLKSEKIKSEDNNQDLVSVSRLLDNASQQQFKEFFKREAEEPLEVGAASEEDEEGLVASGSTSEGNVSCDENKSESETPSAPVKKKSAYSMAPNRVSCPFCSRKFPWSSSLRRHILTHTGQKPFKCSHCPLLFTTKSNCDRHLLRKHGNNATTITNDALNNNTNYLMRNVPERPFKCSNCPSSTFSTYSNLKKHISCKHATNAQGDDIRAQGYEAGSSEDEKATNNENPPRGGDWESQIHAKEAQSMRETTQVQNSDLPFKCHLCEGSFGERQEALDHIKERHLSEYELLMSKNALDNNATTPEENAANNHDEDDSEMRGKFPDYSNRKVICAFCMRRFWSAEDLRRHMRTHTGERPFSCDICRRRFTLKHSMLRHRKKHNVMTNFDSETVNSDDEVHQQQQPVNLETFTKNNNNVKSEQGKTTEESDGNEGGDLISNLLGIRDRGFIDKVLTASPDDAAKLLGVKNGMKE